MGRSPILVFALALCAFGVALATPSLAFAGQRLALVIGNGKYQNVPPLDNPSNDAADLAQALRGLGFEVIEGRDATREGMAGAVHEFSERVRNADLALFFYAGHGLQMSGENYLIPIDAKIENEADVRFNTINLTDIQQEMAGRANIIILDACRNNPFAEKLARNGRGVTTRGLGRVDAAGVGSLIVFSTQPNNVAFDGAGRNSPFTAALLKYVGAPGLEIRQMISKVRGDVLQATDQKQVPWDNSSLVGDVYLAGVPTSSDAQNPAPAAAAPPAPAAPAGQQNASGGPPQTASAVNSATKTVPAATDAATGPAAECVKLATPPVPLAVPAAVASAKIVDWPHAIDVCEQALKDNPSDPRLNYLLGHAYIKTKAYIQAARYFQIATDAGYAEADDDLGYLFVTGLGVVKDYQRAFDLFNKAAIGGSASGMGNLGSMYSNGFFVKEDDAKALYWYEKSIEAGNAFGLAQAAVMYFDGKGAPQDYNMAAGYFQQAADLGDGYSLKFLAIMYERGLLGKPDPAKAAELRLKAAQVDPDSQDPNVPPPRPGALGGHALGGRTNGGRVSGGNGGGYLRPGTGVVGVWADPHANQQFYTGAVKRAPTWHGIPVALPRCWPFCSVR